MFKFIAVTWNSAFLIGTMDITSFNGLRYFGYVGNYKHKKQGRDNQDVWI